MLISNRRDAGYTIISRFEEQFRDYLGNYLTNKYSDVFSNIPSGIFAKAIEKNNNLRIDNISEFFESTDFPDLKDISLYKNHYEEIFKDEIKKTDFIKSMDELYSLRCKIAHIKGYFTSIDLEKLIELTSEISKVLKLNHLLELILRLKSDPNSVIITTPINFIEDFLERSGIINNLPIPDYEFEGGFVGREDDRKKIIQFLKSEKFPVVTLTGAGGVGKTALALKVIQDITERPENQLFDAIVWLSAKENKLSVLGIEDIEPTLKNYEELLDTIINLFGFFEEIIEGTTVEKEFLVENIIAMTNRVLIVIDNLETITDNRIINFILDAPLKVKFLVTSRRGIGQVERRHEIKELKAKEAVYLFRQLCKDKQLEKLLKLPDATINKYVEKVSFYPLAIKWVIGQVARGKDINKIIDSIHTSESDISKFCYEQIFSMLSENCQKVMFALSLIDEAPTPSLLQYTVELDDSEFEDTIEELILVSLVIPEQFLNEKKEISTTYSLLPLTKGYTRLQLNKNLSLREFLLNRLNHVESTITTTERAKKEYKHSLYNFGAKTDEEKIATIIAQTAFQKYQSGFYEDAVEEYRRAVKLAPYFAPIYRNWAVMESYEDHPGEASNLMGKAAELDPSDPQIFLLWGNIYRKNFKYVEANKKYTIAHTLAPKDPIILSAYGQSISHLGNFEEADKMLNESINADSNFSSLKHKVINRTSLAHNSIEWGEYLIKDRDYVSAEEKFKDAIKHCQFVINSNVSDPKLFATKSKAQFKLGLLYFQIGEDNEAVNRMSAIINSEIKSFKQAKYRLSALIELSEYYVKTQFFNNVKFYLKIIENDYKNSPVVKDDYRNQQQRIKLLEEYLNPSNQVEGFVRNVNIERHFAIIQETDSINTYLALRSSFVPVLENLPVTLTGKYVMFTPGISEKNQNTAKNVKIKDKELKNQTDQISNR